MSTITVIPGATFEATLDGATDLAGPLTVGIYDSPDELTAFYGPSSTGVVENPADSGLYAVELTAPEDAGSYSIVWSDGVLFARDVLEVSEDSGVVVKIDKTQMQIGPGRALSAARNQPLYVLEPNGPQDRAVNLGTETLVEGFADEGLTVSLGTGPFISNGDGQYDVFVPAKHYDLYSPNDRTRPVTRWQPVGADGVVTITPDATAAAKGKIRLAGDLGGTADAPTVPGLADQAAATAATDAELAAHTGDTANPHAVTKTQVGLGNVDNTADTAKPVSTAQATALDAKAPLASPALTGAPTAPTPSTSDSSTKLATTAHAHAAAALVALPKNFVTATAGAISPAAGDCVLANAAAGDTYVQLPVTVAVGSLIAVKRTDVSANTVVVTSDTGVLDYGSGTVEMTGASASAVFMYVNLAGTVKWIIVASHGSVTATP